MHTITIKVHDKVLDKVLSFLSNFPEHNIEIVSEKERAEKKKRDFITFLVNHPVEMEKDVSFLTREEAHAR